MTKKIIDQVAEEKRRASLAMGDSAAKADRYAREVREAAQAKKGGK
jgi:hypothetical protein